MPDFILVTGDMVQFNPAFTPAIVTVQPGVLAGTGMGTIGGKPICVQGDEAKVIVPGCPYITASHPIPGVGILSIAALGGDQIAVQTQCSKKPVLLKGSMFTAKFQVATPAQQPAPPGPPIPDASPTYSGTGMFITTNMTVKGT